MTTHTEFLWQIRVYYEDTDAGGVVYYANYLKYLERARTELLRSLGFEQDQLMQNNIAFAVQKVNLDYLYPVKFNEEMTVSATCQTLKKASIEFFQTIKVKNKLCCQGTIKVVCIDLARFRPTKMPEGTYQGLLKYAK